MWFKVDNLKSSVPGGTLCMLGCGNLGTSILKSLIKVPSDSRARFDRFVACVRSESSAQRLEALCKDSGEYGDVVVVRGSNISAVKSASVVILGVDPSQVQVTLEEEGMGQALIGKLLISVVAGWSRERLESLICVELSEEEAKEIWVLRTLPNVAAQVSQSLTAIEEPAWGFPQVFIDVANAIFSHIGKPVHIAPRLMAATTAVGGSTPAFWAIMCDAFIDAAVAVGLPRHMAQAQIYQSMRGTAEMLQSGIQPSELRDMGTSPEGCTIGGIMILEEMGIRGALGKALRESVTIARAMEKDEGEQHVNDTRRP